MKNRLILIEGIPGSGKSTMAGKLKDYLDSKCIPAKVYREGDLHPADLSWCDCLTRDEYQMLLDSYPEHRDSIMQHTLLEDGHAILAYTRLSLHHKDPKLREYFENHEIHGGRISLDSFQALHLQRWKKFTLNCEQDMVYIFECAYLQSHIQQLMGIYVKDLSYITDYMLKLIDTVISLHPKLIYLYQPDAAEAIRRIAAERVSGDQSALPDWIDMTSYYIEASPYGQAHQLKGHMGVVKFFETRRGLDLAVLDQLPIDKAILHIHDFNWDEVYQQLIQEAVTN